MTLIQDYALLAYACGDPWLQAGRWPQIAHTLDELEAEFPGIKAAVIEEVKRMKAR